MHLFFTRILKMKRKHKFLEKTKKFFLDLITSGSGKSCKRFIALGSFFLLGVYAFVGLFTKLNLNSNVIYTLGGLALGNATLSSLDKKFRINLPDKIIEAADKADSDAG